MGNKKKGKGGNSVEKARAKAAKKAKQERSADKKAAKSQNKRDNQLLTSTSKGGKGSGAGAGGGGKGGKGKKPVDDEQDLDALLEQFRESWAAEHAVSEEKLSGPPSRRANATFTACPNGNDLWLIGGEYFDGDRANFYADVYRYSPDKNEWRSYSSPNQPGPRSAHQVVATAQAGGLLWLFGGEFASPRMTSFHHYRDLWVFSIASHSWERIETKVKPSARSGHRMAAWKQYLILFGGFIDTGARTTYLNDCWVFDTLDYKWTELKSNPIRWPSPRSGFSFLSTPEGIVLYGGYVKRYVKGQRTQGVALDDIWFLSTTTGGTSPQPLEPAAWTWAKRRRVGYYPNPARSGTTMALWANRAMGVLFGGVTDTEADEETMESEFWKDLYAYNLAGTGRWVSLNLKRPKKKAGGGGGAAAKERRRREAEEAARRRKEEEEEEERKYKEEEEEEDSDSDEDEDEDEEDEEEKERLRAIEQARAAREAEAKAQSRDDAGPVDANRDANGATSISESGAPNGKEASPAPAEDDDADDPQRTVPRERYNAMLAVQRNTLYLYGGIWENNNREYTMDDFYTLDLSKMERYVCLRECPIDTLEWNESDSEDDSGSGSDSDSDSSSSSSSESGDDAEQEGIEYVAGNDSGDEGDIMAALEGDDEAAKLAAEELEARRKQKAAEQEELRKKAQAFMGVAKDTTRTQEDILSTPYPGENLRTFYDRTKEYWAQTAHTSGESQHRGKELRRDGFTMAEKRYEEYKPILEEIERIQAQAGLDAAEARNANARPGIAGGGPGVDSRNRR
ncbi:Kelch repeat-containing protein 3 [Tilletia horrida]|nr:Kelch repeat-containing protein 3 [Tilletia horrida]